MRLSRFGAGFIVALLAVTAVPVVAGAAQAGDPPGSAAADRAALTAAAGPSGRVSVHDETGLVRFVGTPSTDPIDRSTSVAPDAGPEAAARGFLADHGRAFGADEAADLVARTVVEGTAGNSTVRFDQAMGGVPVIGGGLSVSVNGDGEVLSAAGELLPDAGLDTTPAVSAADAAAAAAAAVAKWYSADPSTVEVDEPVLSVFNPALLGGPGLRETRLVWRTEARTSGGDEPVREFVLVDAADGSVGLHFNQIAHAKDRRMCDDNNVPSAVENCATAGPVIRTEGGAATGIADNDNVYTYTGLTYDFYFTRFGRDSLDGAGLPLYSETRFCDVTQPCPYANAYWNGTQMTYGQGVGSDDVVGHELSHGFTEFTSGLYYYYQAGAINESMSDVFGEFIDLLNVTGSDTAPNRWLIAEDSSLGAIRDMETPTAFGDPDRMQSGNYHSAASDSGGVHANSGVNNKATFLLTDGGTFNGRTVTALGLTKVAAIYYEVETALLQSGSDYGDLFDMLPQACTNRVGGAEAITAADCLEVVDAVTATEMHLEPTAIPHPDAPSCAGGETRTDVVTDAIPSGAPGWSTQTSAGLAWVYATGFAHSDPYALWGRGNAIVADTSILRSWTVPSSGSTYLLVHHANEFEDGGTGTTHYDGGVIEYSTAGSGGPWTDASALIDHGGYNGTIASGFANPLAGQSGFIGTSHGYRQSRINLTSFAGTSPFIRFHVGHDNAVASFGWFVDDLTLFNCVAGGSGVPAPPNFDNDSDTDRSVFRPSTGQWFAQGQGTVFLGVSGDVPVPADYNGDGDSERAVFRSGAWYIEGVGSPTFFGLSSDIPVPGDYDGDGDADIAVYRPSVGGWYVMGGSTTFFGLSTDIAVPNDYDGDGDTDVAVWRPSVGGWYVNGQTTQFLGLSGDIPVPGDYDDNGDIERGIWRPAVGGWYVEGAAAAFVGLSGDRPVPGDYDGDGDADRAIWRPAVGGWYTQSQGTVFLGLSSDIPLPLPNAIYRNFF